MESPVLRLENVWKSYGRVNAVHGLDLTVPARSVYCFLGPNGAGKTTTIRLMLALQRMDRGSIQVFGKSLQRDRIAVLRGIGALVDSPSLYLHLTGRENLEVNRRILGCPRRAIDEALDVVDLRTAADRPVSGYSLGMRQRLGLARALLGSPSLLVLDEPTNGLDPAGIREVRALIRDLPQRRNLTVFLSSHLLSEVEQMATHLAILRQGEKQFEGTLEDLQQRSRPLLSVEVDRGDSAALLIEQAGYAVRREGRRLYLDGDPQPDPAVVNRMLVSAGFAVSRLTVERPTLEEMFLEITREVAA